MSPLVGRIFVAWFICRVLWGLLLHTQGLLYDLKDIRQKQEQQAHPHARKYKIKPLLTTVVFARNNGNSIQECLKSIVKSSYRKHEILVIDNASTDHTREAVNEFIAAHPKQAITMIKKRKPAPQETIAVTLSKKQYKGDLILFLDGSSILEPQTLKHAVQCAAATQAEVIKLNTRLALRPLSFARLTHFFDTLLSSKKRKWGSGLPENLLPQSLILRRTVLGEMGRRVPESLTYAYAHDAVVIRQPAVTFEDIFERFYEVATLEYKALANVKRVSKNTVYHWKKRTVFGVKHVAPVLDVLAFTYLAYLAIELQNTLLFSVGWLLLLAVLGVALWSDSALRTADKYLLTALLPIAYVFLLAAAACKLAAQAGAGIEFFAGGYKQSRTYSKTRLKMQALLKT